MERSNGMPAGMLSSGMTGAGGFLGLDMSLQQHPHHQQHGQQQQLLHHPPLQQHMIPFQTTTPPSNDVGNNHPLHPMRHGSYVPPFGVLRAKQQPAMSSEEDSGFGDVEGDVDARRGALPQGLPSFSQQSTPSPWQRMKWTDGMVRLLISVVYHVGDDVGGGADGEQPPPPPPPPHGTAAKGKKTTASALLQKKGKWKSVSQAMMEKGFYVSPQQCEDKFNDLNKRYKRVNDLLGKGTACRVVENQALLDTMDHLSPTAKEEARKLLNSKHLFFPEMCRYHNAVLSSCSSQPPPQAAQPPHAEQQQCLHHPAGQMEATGIKVSGRGGGGVMLEDEGIIAEEDDEDDDVDSEEEDDYDDDDDEDDDDLDDQNKAHHRLRHHHNRQGEGEEDEDSKLGLGAGPMKRPRRTPSQQQLLSSASASPPLSLSLSSPNFTSVQQLKSELVAMARVGGEQQQRQWIRKRSAELEEQRVGYQSRAFQLERQRFKWLRFSSNKEREMERMKLDNDRLRLENDRMLLLLRQKEIELITNSRAGGSEQQLHYSAAHSGRQTHDDQPSGIATA